jgi:hypothetical protein
MKYFDYDVYFRNFGIIEKIKHFFRRKIMPTQPYYVNIFDARQKRIMNSYLVEATDETHAMQIILRTFPSQYAQVIANSIYVYPINDILPVLKQASIQSNTLPILSFIPLNGTMPVKKLNLPKVSETKSVEVPVTTQNEIPKKTNEQIITESTIPVQPVVEKKVVVSKPTAMNPNHARSLSFREEHKSPTQNNNVSEEQRQILSSLGISRNENMDEGTNLLVNTATGKNLNLNNRRETGGPSDTLTQEQYELLKKTGAHLTETVMVEESDQSDIAKKYMLPDAELMEIPQDGTISPEYLEKIQAEYSEMSQQTGLSVDDSKPDPTIRPEKLTIPLNSNIDNALKLKAMR